MQVLGQAIEETKTLDQDKLADYLRTHTFQTIVGDIKFGSNGEWTEPRVLETQFRDVTGHEVDQFKDLSKEVILWPSEYKSGELKAPYGQAK
jgi:branched-chain amino acid transport system substrate-binding protein